MKFKKIDDDLKNYIFKHFKYNPDTGSITRNDRRNSSGSYDKYGYLIIKIKGIQFKSHRIAWLLHYGVEPTMIIDHVNRDKRDNRISNLRQVTQEENVDNTYKLPNKDTGVVGVYIDKSTKGLKSRYTTRIKNKTYRFRTLDEAIKKRKKYGKRIY